MPEEAAVLAALCAMLAGPDAAWAGRLGPQTRIEAVDGLDSIRLIETIALLEERFTVEVATHALDQLETLGDIVAAVAQGRPAG